jgi:hypothetical protein
VTFFPADRALLDEAIRTSGLDQQEWVARAVRERIDRQEDLRRLVQEALRRFKTTCLWNVKTDQPMASLVPELYTRLRKHGGMAGIVLARKLEALAPEDVKWR